MYLNGVLKHSPSTTDTDCSNIGSLLIGTNLISSSSEYIGLLDDIKIYNYALSAIQIQHEYQQSRLAISKKYEPWKWADLLNLAFIMKGDQLYEKNQRISYLRQHPIN